MAAFPFYNLAATKTSLSATFGHLLFFPFGEDENQWWILKPQIKDKFPKFLVFNLCQLNVDWLKTVDFGDLFLAFFFLFHYQRCIREREDVTVPNIKME